MTSVDVYLENYELDARELPNDHVFLSMREHDDGTECTLFFENTREMRTFLARALSELRRIERGDLPYNATDDRIEVAHG